MPLEDEEAEEPEEAAAEGDEDEPEEGKEDDVEDAGGHHGQMPTLEAMLDPQSRAASTKAAV